MVGYRLLPPVLGFSYCCWYPQLSHENISGLKGFKLLPYVEYGTFVHWPFCAAIEIFVPLSSILKSGKGPWNKSQMQLWSVKPHQFASVTFMKQGVESATLKILASNCLLERQLASCCLFFSIYKAFCLNSSYAASLLQYHILRSDPHTGLCCCCYFL